MVSKYFCARSEMSMSQGLNSSSLTRSRMMDCQVISFLCNKRSRILSCIGLFGGVVLYRLCILEFFE